nr:reverse transcriptase domain-containing protein [Tanacetum cinerariifolium]
LHNDVQNIHEELAVYINTPNWDRPTICYNDDDDEDSTIAITPILSTKDPDNSLSMGDEHLDTISATESDELIKSSVENLVPIPSESEGIPDNMCDVPFHENSPPLYVSKYQFEDFFHSNNDSTSIDDDSFSIDDIEYVEASPPDSELVSLEVMEIVIPEEGGINANILITIKDDILQEISSSSTTTRFDISLPDYEAFYDDHVKEISSGSTTTHSDFSLYDSFIFDLSINPFPPADRSDFYHEEFANELAHIISPPEMHKQKQQEKDEVQIYKFWQMFKKLHINITLADALIIILKYQKMLKALISNKEKLLELANTHLNENCSAVILKKLHEKLGD